MPATKKAVHTLPANGVPELVTWLDADDVNGDYFLNDGKTQIAFYNPTAGEITATLEDVKDSNGRQLAAAEKAVAIPADGFALAGDFLTAAWNQRSGDEKGGIKISYSAAGLKLLPFRSA